MTATDHSFRDVLAERIAGRPLAVVVHSRSTVRHALLVTLDLLGFDVRVAADEVEAVVSIQGVTPRALIVETSMWPGTRARVVDQLVARKGLRRLSIVILGEAASTTSTRDAPTSRLSIHRIPCEGVIDKLLDVLDDVITPDSAA